MVLAIISDTHLPRGSRRLPEECVRRLRAADAILHGGDFVSAGFLDELERLGRPVVGVYGNMDETVLRETLPHDRIVEVAGARIGMVHDAGPRAGRAERLVARFAGCGAIVYGHTHLPELTRHRGTWIVNPGSPTERRRAPRRTMVVAEAANGRFEPRLLELA